MMNFLSVFLPVLFFSWRPFGWLASIAIYVVCYPFLLVFFGWLIEQEQQQDRLWQEAMEWQRELRRRP